jgi:hypothetical protein
MSPAPNDSELTALDWVIALLCCPLGVVVGVYYLSRGKPKAGEMLLLSIIVWMILAAVIIVSQALGVGSAGS